MEGGTMSSQLAAKSTTEAEGIAAGFWKLTKSAASFLLD